MKVKLKAPGRQVLEEVNLKLQDDPRARNACAEAFRAVYVDSGANHEIAVEVDHRPEEEFISIRVFATGVAASGTVDVPAQPVVSEEDAAAMQAAFERANPRVELSDAQLDDLAARVAAQQGGQ